MFRFLSILCFISLSSCRFNDPKTIIREKPLAIDSSTFQTIEDRFHHKADAPSAFLGGLTPRLPLAEVYSLDFKTNCIWKSRGMMLTCNNLIALIKDTLTLIDTEEKFRNIFVPIDNEQEALSYVAYLSRTYPKYDIVKKFRYRVYSSHFPSTYAKRIAGGFQVLLHDKKVFGCGPHPNYYKLFKVTESGQITLLQTVKMFEDPEEDGLCVD